MIHASTRTVKIAELRGFSAEAAGTAWRTARDLTPHSDQRTMAVMRAWSAWAAPAMVALVLACAGCGSEGDSSGGRGSAGSSGALDAGAGNPAQVGGTGGSAGGKIGNSGGAAQVGGLGGSAGSDLGNSAGSAQAGAAGANASLPPVPTTKKLSELTTDEKGQLCAWYAGLFGGYGHVTECGASSVQVYPSQAVCIADAFPADCMATVEDFETCTRAEVPSQNCVLMYDECRPITAC